MNWLQIKSGITHALTTAGTIGTTVAFFSPQWGTEIQLAVGAASAIVGGISAIVGIFTGPKTQAGGLTSAEAAAALNAASLAKAKNLPVP